MPNRTDQQLIAEACAGDRTAQEELWRRHRRWVGAIVLAHRPRTVEVDDLMQEVAVKLVSRLRTLRDPEAFRPWLRQITINVCRGSARSLRPTLRLVGTDRERSSEAAESGGVSVPPATTELPERIADRREWAQRVLGQLMTLPSEYREPLLLRCVRSMTYEQIGQVLDLPVTTIETRLARARRMLRDELGAEMAVI
ncbi:MAG: RNA polymerase sigma factor [Planctomycetota bacterium]